MSFNNSEKNILGNHLIAAIVNKEIFYNLNSKQFENNDLGSLGFTFDELINLWHSNLCFELVQRSKILDEEIWTLNNEDMNLYLNKFTEVWSNIDIPLPSKYEEELSTYYFSIKGTSEGWDQIYTIIKSKRNSILK
jgi:hypothetical protein